MCRSFLYLQFMITTIAYSNTNFPIKSEKVFEKLFNLNETLEGQSINIKSIFNEADNDPSMILFYSTDDEIYRFKDFSTGRYGDAADVVEYMYNITNRQEAFIKILDLFKNDTDVDLSVLSTHQKVSKDITSYKVRGWNKRDEEYWKAYYIGGSFLKKYNVKPLDEYVMSIIRGSSQEDMKFNNLMCYGFFNAKDELCKIYNPKNTKGKFLKVKEFIQGEDQLTLEGQCLIIVASMKDLGAFKTMKIPNIELIAPDSENVHVPKDRLDYFKTKYKYIFTMFDNDLAGMKAMKEYKELYDIPYLYFTVENDMADCVKEHGPGNTKRFFIPVLKNAIKRENNKLNKKP